MTYYDPQNNYAEIQESDLLTEIAKERGLVTEKPKPKNKYNSNGSLRVMPKIGEDYFFIGDGGSIEDFTFDGASVDRFIFYSQNMFDTKEAAQKARTMQLVAQPLIAKIWEIDADWECDWEDWGTQKSYVYYSYQYQKFDWSFKRSLQHQGVMHMSREAINHILSDTYTDKQRAAFMNDVKLWESFGGKIGDEDNNQ